MTLAELQARLRSHNQFVALESPDPARETVGGILATGSSALIRYAFGTPRDQVIGITVATADGRLVKSGGRVVKNVAGYDLCKLYTGSFGTLGVIVEATFRVRPLPPVSRTWVAAVPSAEAGEAALAELMASDLPATFLQAAHASAFAALPRDLDANREAPWLLAVGMDGNATLTDWMIEEANHRSGLKNRKVLDGEASNELRAALAVACGPSQSLSVRLSGPSSEVFPVMAEAANVAGREALELSATAAAGNGVVYLHFRAQSRPISGDPASKAELIPPESALRLAKWLCDRATAMEGGMAALSCPPELRAQFPMWGVAAPADGLQRRIRRQFDPGLALNRGRLFANEAALGPVEPSGV